MKHLRLELKRLKQDKIKNRKNSNCYFIMLFYRLERAFYLDNLPGKFIVRVLRRLSFIYLPKVDIPRLTEIGGGFTLVHPSLGFAINGVVKLGDNARIFGGNIIGCKDNFDKKKPFRVGDNLVMGVNSVIIGPVVLGDDITIGAQAVITKSFFKKQTLILNNKVLKK